MPTERFFRLMEPKKQAIRDAAIKEFASVSFDKVSINKIIQNANISRGSFYTYFEDKQDVLFFIFEDVHNQCNQFMRETLQHNGGDYFDTFEKFLGFCLELFENKGLFELAKNVFSYYRGSQAFFGIDGLDDEKRLVQVERILEFVNMEQMRITRVEDFMMLISLSMANLALTIIAFYQGEEDRDVLYIRYKTGLELLKHGALST